MTAPVLPDPVPPSGDLTPDTLAAAVAACQPEGAIVVDEGLTSSLSYFQQAAGAPRHTYLGHVGGAIGQGLPVAVGAAVACRDRPVIALQADGSGMYTPQALWTAARERLDVTTVVCANHGYRILQAEFARSGGERPGPAAASVLDLGKPEVDWVHLAEGLGVPARRVTTAGELVSALRWSLAEAGPHLLEAVL